MNGKRWRALIWLLLAILIASVAGVQFSGRMPLQTNLMALLPPTERNPLAEQAISKLTPFRFTAARQQGFSPSGRRHPAV